jgi:hypothetical protein
VSNLQIFHGWPVVGYVIVVALVALNVVRLALKADRQDRAEHDERMRRLAAERTARRPGNA